MVLLSPFQTMDIVRLPQDERTDREKKRGLAGVQGMPTVRETGRQPGVSNRRNDQKTKNIPFLRPGGSHLCKRK